MEEHKDYFGEVIEPGDTVIRPMHSELQTEKVTRLTPKAIYFDRDAKHYNGPLRISINTNPITAANTPGYSLLNILFIEKGIIVLT